MHSPACRLLSCTLVLAGIGSAEAQAALETAGAEDLGARAREVLQRHCGACHGPGGKALGGFDYLLDRDRLVARNQVVPGRSADSLLYQRAFQGEMPPPGKQPRPGPEQIAVLRRWIDAGAPAFGATVTPSALRSDAAVVRVVLADLRALEPRQRRFTRYLSLAHLANAAPPAEELERTRYAVAKLVNSLSWHARISRPHPIDAAQTIYRLDLREYKWTARPWDRLATVYPYRLPESGPDTKACAELTGCSKPVLRGDWFLATASRPPFYHDFLQLPNTDRSLERLLQVDVLADLQEDNAVRAGFNGSGVARNNRLLERHDAPFGAYWRSYDFSDNTGRQNLFERPLGPVPGPASFTQAGGEIIFHLPNGLQGYLLVDGDGRRVDKAPGDIVSDPKRPDRLVENGLSCLGCHFNGLLPKDDQVRAHVLKNAGAFTAEDQQTILALYAPAVRMRKLMKDDMDRFARALDQAGVPSGEPEPISTVVLRYEAVLDLRTAAAEVGLKPDDFAARLRRTPQLSRTLGALLARGGTVQRQVFEETYPELVRAFHLSEDAGARETTGTVPSPFPGHLGPIRALAFAPDGRSAATGGEDRTLRLWDLATGKEKQRFAGHSDEVVSVAFTPDGRRLLSAGRDRTVRLWDVDSGRELRRFQGHTDAVRCVVVSPDGRHVLSGGEDRTLRLWEIDTGQERHCFTGHSGAVTAVAFSPDGRLAVSSGHDRTVRLWDVRQGQPRGVWSRHTSAVYSVAFSPDGRRLLSGGNDKVLYLWDVAEGKDLRRFRGHANAIVRVAFTPDGQRLLSASSRYQTPDRVVRLWDLSTGQELPALDADLEQVECVAFSADGRQALLSHAGSLRLLAIGKER